MLSIFSDETLMTGRVRFVKASYFSFTAHPRGLITPLWLFDLGSLIHMYNIWNSEESTSKLMNYTTPLFHPNPCIRFGNNFRLAKFHLAKLFYPMKYCYCMYYALLSIYIIENGWFIWRTGGNIYSIICIYIKFDPWCGYTRIY